MRRLVPLALIVLLLGAARAEAVTVKDIIDLTRAGLGEEVLLALIEVDGGVFNIDTATLTDLKKAGVSERVIEAMVRSGRTPPPEPPEPPAPLPGYDPEPPQPQVIVIEHERTVVEQVAVPFPVYVAVPQRTHRRGHVVTTQPIDPSPGFGAPTPVTSQRTFQQPVYWGWGGKLRPDAWKPAGVKHSGKDRGDGKGKGKGGRGGGTDRK